MMRESLYVRSEQQGLGLERMAKLLREPHRRVEIRGFRQISVVVDKQKRTDFFFVGGLNVSFLDLLGRDVLLLHVLVVELYNHDLSKVLASLVKTPVQRLDIANCALGQDVCLQSRDGACFDSLTSLNVLSSHWRVSHLNALLHQTPSLQHFSLHLVADALDIFHLFDGVALKHLSSIDLRGRFVSTNRCFRSNLLPQLSNICVVETLGSKVHLGHLIHGNVKEMLLGRTIACSWDIAVLMETLCSPSCRMKRLHLFAIDLQPDVMNELVDCLFQAIHFNQTLEDIVLGGGTIFQHKREELNHVTMRNKYLTLGLGRIQNMRLLPHYLAKYTATSGNIMGRVGKEDLDAIYFMARERPDLFGNYN